jgi:FixJ family two-component response regulator
MSSSRILDGRSASRYPDALDIIEALNRHLREAAASDPLIALAEIAAIKATLADREREAVRSAVPRHSWREIGTALGVTKQAVFQRFRTEWAVGIKSSMSKKQWREEVRRSLRD